MAITDGPNFRPPPHKQPEWAFFINALKRHVHEGDPSIPIEDFKRYEEMVGIAGLRHLREQWEEAKIKRARRELIAECTGPLDPHRNSATQLQMRTNRLLAAILERLG